MIRRLAILLSASLVLPAAAHADTNTITHRVMGKHPQAAACYDAAGARQASALTLAICDEALGRADLDYSDQMATVVNRGVLRYRLNQYDGAIADFDAALALEPNHPEALIDKGLAIIASGRAPQTAVPLFNAGLAQKPDASVAYFGRATAHEMAANYRAAYQDYKRAELLRPKWQAPKQALSRFRFK